jgi:hypothetical protein
MEITTALFSTSSHGFPGTGWVTLPMGK